MPKGFIIAAPGSGSGKTTITLGILRALTNQGVSVRAAKSGPDYIDPKFHEAACRRTCVNLDAWAMPATSINQLAQGDDLLIVEGAMGLFDGAPPDGKGAVADLAKLLGLPVILVVDASHMAQSVAPLVAGFANHDPGVSIAGVILNKVGSPRHDVMLRRALEQTGIPTLGTMMRDASITQPSRHLGLVQASEHPDLETFLETAAHRAEIAIDLDALLACATNRSSTDRTYTQHPPAQRIAIARDEAFAFSYPHTLQGWRNAGAELTFFSPLADQPAPDADLIYLPGGYPELHAGRLSSAATFFKSLAQHAEKKHVFGECGGYMTLGDGLIDADGTRHEMAGLLRLETSFAQRKLHLGYRNLKAISGPFHGNWKGHEFHYATTLKAEGHPLFQARDAQGTPLPDMGLTQGNTCGSFAHLIHPA